MIKKKRCSICLHWLLLPFEEQHPFYRLYEVNWHVVTFHAQTDKVDVARDMSLDLLPLWHSVWNDTIHMYIDRVGSDRVCVTDMLQRQTLSFTRLDSRIVREIYRNYVQNKFVSLCSITRFGQRARNRYVRFITLLRRPLRFLTLTDHSPWPNFFHHLLLRSISTWCYPCFPADTLHTFRTSPLTTHIHSLASLRVVGLLLLYANFVWVCLRSYSIGQKYVCVSNKERHEMWRENYVLGYCVVQNGRN